jgi:Cytochrome C oxidase, cbb3-type, subunit III
MTAERRRGQRTLAQACVVGLAACIAMPTTAQRDEPLPGDYRVIDGRVDRGTYAGWRLFHSTCHVCHGLGGVGTDIAPSLVERVGTMTPREFAARVLTSYRLVSPGDNGPLDEREREDTLDELMRRDRDSPRGRIVMPAWEADDAVPPHVLDLYAYLSARADGQLGPGRPKSPLARRR